MTKVNSSGSRVDGGGEKIAGEAGVTAEVEAAKVAGGSRSNREESLDEKLRYLNLREEEEEDEVLEED